MAILLIISLILIGCVSVAPTGEAYLSEDINEDVFEEQSFKEDEKTGSYTIMLYMIGSDLESQNASASYDILEMLESDIDLSSHNVVLYSGGCAS